MALSVNRLTRSKWRAKVSNTLTLLWADNGGYTMDDAKERQQIWANELAQIHAKYLAQAILDNSKYAREACAVGKGAHNRSPLLSDNDAARPWGSG